MNETRRKSAWQRIDTAVEYALYYVSGTLLIGIAIAVFYNVVMRYLFSSSALWAEDVPRILFLWAMYLGVAVATKRGQNLRVTFVIDRFPPLARLVLEVAMHLMVIAMIVTIVWQNRLVIELNAGIVMLSTGWSQVIRYIPLSLSGVLMALYTLHLIRRSIRDYQDSVGGGRGD